MESLPQSLPSMLREFARGVRRLLLACLVVAAGGAVYDRVGHGDAKSWDAGAQVKTAVEKDAWTLEMAVPLKALGIGDTLPTHWRANVYRNRHAGPDGAQQAFSPTPSGNYDRPDSFGHLYFTAEIPWAKPTKADRPTGIRIEELKEGGALLRLDLTGVPRGTKVYRARLFAERRPIAEGEDASSPVLYGLLTLLPHIRIICSSNKHYGRQFLCRHVHGVLHRVFDAGSNASQAIEVVTLVRLKHIHFAAPYGVY